MTLKDLIKKSNCLGVDVLSYVGEQSHELIYLYPELARKLLKELAWFISSKEDGEMINEFIERYQEYNEEF